MDVNAEAGPPHVQAVDEPPGGATGSVTSAESQVQKLPGNNGENDDPRLDTEAAAEPIAGIADGDRNPSDQTFGESSGLRTYTDLGFSSGNENLMPTPGCRICYQGAELGELLSPCRCAGTVRYAHQHCLLKWICERGSTTCEICNCKFNMVPIRMKPPHQWQSITMTVVEKVQVIAVLLGTMFLLASLSWLLWSLLSPEATWQRNDILFQICYGMYAVMDIVCVGLVAHEGRAVCKVFRRWRAVNLQWNVQTYNKCRDLNCPPHNQTLPSGRRVSQEQAQTSELDSSPQCPLFSTCLNATPETPVSPPEPSPDERVMRDTSV